MKIYSILKSVLFISIFLISLTLHSQTLRGVVVDDATKSPLPGASIIILNTDPIKGAISDIDGKFKFPNLKQMRVSIKVSYVGFHDRYYNNLELLQLHY